VSQCKTILGYAVEAFLSFIFPFRCEGVLIPILPSSLKEYLSAPVPYIVGVHPSLIDNSVEAEVSRFKIRVSLCKWMKELNNIFRILKALISLRCKRLSIQTFMVILLEIAFISLC